jgi:hypothetical protein
MGIGLYRLPGVAVSPTSLVYLQPEVLAKYTQLGMPATACATPKERRWAGIACAALLVLAPVLIALAA